MGNKRWRIVIDYKALNNKQINRRRISINIVEILDQLGSANTLLVQILNIFYVVFLSSFHQIPDAHAEDSIYILIDTTNLTTFGLKTPQ
jgi:hypothetical protein